ncbi:MAG: cytochrome c [Anaerolineae bacterium]|nr:cytochrome c [Anaerolineae bacterium]
MNISPKVLLGLSALLALALVGCIQTSSEPEIVRTRVVPTSVPTVLPTSFDMNTGAASFAQNCAACHGPSGLGDGPAAAGFTCAMPALAQREPGVTPEEWFDITWNGQRSSDTCIMPPWNARLTQEETWDTVAYAYSLVYGPEAARAGRQSWRSAPQTSNPPIFWMTGAGRSAAATQSS